jgi:large subunit ribosomal protein L23
MNQERIYKILLGPVVSEKTSVLAEKSNQIVFKVVRNATKPEIKTAIEKLFNVKVQAVQVLNVKGKTKRTRHGLGVRSDWKKAYVRLEAGQELDLAVAE